MKAEQIIGKLLDAVVVKNKAIDDVIQDQIAYGVGFMEVGLRKWWNPMRWIKGLTYFKRIKPSNVYNEETKK